MKLSVAMVECWKVQIQLPRGFIRLLPSDRTLFNPATRFLYENGDFGYLAQR